MRKKQFFTALRLSRDDFETRGWNAEQVSDAEMNAIAARIGRSILDGGDFWLAIDCVAEEMGLHTFEFEIEDKLCELDHLEQAVTYLEGLGKLTFCDEKIDDGCNDSEEDEYVMMRSYDLDAINGWFHIKLYYGNNTHELGTFDVTRD